MPGCPIHEYEANLAEPVLRADIAEAARQEELMRAYAASQTPEGAA